MGMQTWCCLIWIFTGNSLLSNDITWICRRKRETKQYVFFYNWRMREETSPRGPFSTSFVLQGNLIISENVFKAAFLSSTLAATCESMQCGLFWALPAAVLLRSAWGPWQKQPRTHRCHFALFDADAPVSLFLWNLPSNKTAWGWSEEYQIASFSLKVGSSCILVTTFGWSLNMPGTYDLLNSSQNWGCQVPS